MCVDGAGKGAFYHDGERRSHQRAVPGAGQGRSPHTLPVTRHQKPLKEENRRLLRELEIVREKRDILKKAIVIFSKTPKAGSGS